MLYTDLREIKTLLDIDPDDTSEDKKLLIYNTVATEWISELLNYRDVFMRVRTQYYKGTGTQKLVLRNRPVFPNPPAPYQPITVTYDEFGYFGQGPGAFNDTNTIPYVYGVDYTLQVDWDIDNDGVDEASRSAILIRINEYWLKPTYRQTGLLSPFVGEDTGSIKVVYTAGWTVDTLPAPFRMAADFLISSFRYIWPLGMPLGGESYQERSISHLNQRKDYLLSQVKPLIWPYRSWAF